MVGCDQSSDDDHPILIQDLLDEEALSSCLAVAGAYGVVHVVEELKGLTQTSVDQQGPLALVGLHHLGPPTFEGGFEAVHNRIESHVIEYGTSWRHRLRMPKHVGAASARYHAQCRISGLLGRFGRVVRKRSFWVRVSMAAWVPTRDRRYPWSGRRPFGHAGWIIRNDGAATGPAPPRRFVSGESLPYLGRSVRLTVHPTDDARVAVQFHHWAFDVDVPRSLQGEERLEKVRTAFEAWYRDRASKKLPPRVERIAGRLGVKPKAVLIRDQRRRWASCAPDGTLRFNWRAVMAPPALLDIEILG